MSELPAAKTMISMGFPISPSVAAQLKVAAPAQLSPIICYRGRCKWVIFGYPAAGQVAEMGVFGALVLLSPDPESRPKPASASLDVAYRCEVPVLPRQIRVIGQSARRRKAAVLLVRRPDLVRRQASAVSDGAWLFRSGRRVATDNP